MTRPKPPRLPELGGMTEAGFNRVVAMITHWDFVPRYGFGSEAAYWDWRALLPKVRNKKQRKSDTKRVNYGKPFPLPRCCECDKRLEMFDDYTLQGKRYCGACTMQQVSGTWEPTEPLVKPVGEWRAFTAQEIVDALNSGIADAREQTTKPYVPRTPKEKSLAVAELVLKALTDKPPESPRKSACAPPADSRRTAQ